MNNIKELYQHHPCKNCPFRKDCLSGWLGEDRAKEIFETQTFTCHKTFDPNRKQCAGHMMAVPHNAFVELADEFEIELNLKGRELLFDTKQEFVNHHKNEN